MKVEEKKQDESVRRKNKKKERICLVKYF